MMKLFKIAFYSEGLLQIPLRRIMFFYEIIRKTIFKIILSGKIRGQYSYEIIFKSILLNNRLS